MRDREGKKMKTEKRGKKNSLWNKVKYIYYFNDIGKCKGKLLWGVF
jgi:hypothetical protein